MNTSARKESPASTWHTRHAHAHTTRTMRGEWVRVVTEGSGFSLEALPLHHVAQEVGKVDVEQVPAVRHHDLYTTSPPMSSSAMVAAVP